MRYETDEVKHNSKSLDFDRLIDANANRQTVGRATWSKRKRANLTADTILLTDKFNGINAERCANRQPTHNFTIPLNTKFSHYIFECGYYFNEKVM